MAKPGLAMARAAADNAVMGTWVGYIAKRTQAFIQSPSAEMNRWQKVARYLIELTRHCARQLIEDRAQQMAAALVYHTLFSLIPTLVLMLVVGKLFVGPAELAEYKEGTVDYVLQWLNESSAALATGVEAQTKGSSDEFAQTAEALTQQIDQWFDKLQAINFGAIGAVGVLLFIYGATGLLATIERSFNRICDTSSNRPLYIRLPLYYTVITLGPLLLALGQYLQNMVFGWFYAGVETVTATAGGDVESGQGIGWAAAALVRLVYFLSPLVATWLVITAIYVFLPNTKVKVRPAMIGALVAAIGIVAEIELFGLYVRGAAATTLYGPLALLPLFLLWLYLLWLTVLFGLELAHTLQTLPSERLKPRHRTGDEFIVLDARWAIPTMAAAAESFGAGKPITADQIAHRLSIPARSAVLLAEHLLKQGLLNQVAVKGPADGYSLSRPADKIPLNEVVEAGRSLAPLAEESTLPAGRVIGEARLSVERSLENQTLQDAITGSPDRNDPQ